MPNRKIDYHPADLRSLTDTAWLPVTPPPDGWSAVTLGGNMTITDPGAMGSQRFYRLEAANP